jgi:hypothetical protein
MHVIESRGCSSSNMGLLNLTASAVGFFGGWTAPAGISLASESRQRLLSEIARFKRVLSSSL